MADRELPGADQESLRRALAVGHKNLAHPARERHAREYGPEPEPRAPRSHTREYGPEPAREYGPEPAREHHEYGPEPAAPKRPGAEHTSAPAAKRRVSIVEPAKPGPQTPPKGKPSPSASWLADIVDVLELYKIYQRREDMPSGFDTTKMRATLLANYSVGRFRKTCVGRPGRTGLIALWCESATASVLVDTAEDLWDARIEPDLLCQIIETVAAKKPTLLVGDGRRQSWAEAVTWWYGSMGTSVLSYANGLLSPPPSSPLPMPPSSALPAPPSSDPEERAPITLTAHSGPAAALSAELSDAYSRVFNEFGA